MCVCVSYKMISALKDPVHTQNMLPSIEIKETAINFFLGAYNVLTNITIYIKKSDSNFLFFNKLFTKLKAEKLQASTKFSWCMEDKEIWRHTSSIIERYV